MPRIQALRGNQPVTEVNEGETLDVDCSVERVYPVDDLQFQLMSRDTAVSSRESGVSPDTNPDGTYRVLTVFSVAFSGWSFSATRDGLKCNVSHSRGDNQSDSLQLTVRPRECVFVYVDHSTFELQTSISDLN